MTIPLRSPCVNKWVSDGEQLASNVGLQSVLSPCCPWSSSESELLSLKVRFFGGFGTRNSPLRGTGLVADGKSGYITVCLDFELIPVFLSNNQICGLLVSSNYGNGERHFARTI